MAELELAQTNTQELTNLRSQLAQQKRTIEDQRYDIASLEGNLGVQEAQLKANLRQVQLQNNRLQEELAAVSSKADEELEARFAQVVAELNTNREELGSRSRELAATNERVSQLQTESTEIRRQLAASTGNAAATGRLTAALEAKNVELGGHESVIRSLETEVVRFRSLLEKNNLQNKRLQDELAAVSSKADAELGDALAELNSRGDELDGLKGELAGARSALQNSDSDYGELLAALEQARGDAQKNSRATRKLVDKLETEQTQQLELLTEQRRQIASLEGKVSVTQSRAENLRQALDQQIHQKAEIEARFAQAEAELNTNREKLGSRSRELAATNKRVSQLQTESAEIRRQLTASTGNAVTTGQLTAALEAKNVELAKSESVIKSLKSDVDTLNSLLEKNRKQRQYVTMRSPFERLPDTSKIRLPKNVKLGKYYALVVGNNNYKYLPVLKNARNDARAVQKILNDEYNFETQLLLDVTKKTYYEAAKELLEKVGENDLVLFYYAGHGFETKNDSYWLPIETEQDIASYERQGVSSDVVSRWIKAMPAKHVFVITDSCYSGRGIEATGGVKWNVQDLELALPFYLNNRSRTMLTSGGNRPVLDGDGEGGEHSVFTKELIGLLEENRGVLTGEALYAYLLQRVKSRAQGFNVNQSPKFGKIVKADHGSGQFVFLHRNMQG